jgi:hypothetical protein
MKETNETTMGASSSRTENRSGSCWDKLCCCWKRRDTVVDRDLDYKQVPKAKRTNREFEVRDKIAMLTNGEKEVWCAAGRIDVLTQNMIVEVKKIALWKAAIGQVLSYHVYYPRHEMVIHLFGKKQDWDRLHQTIEHVCNKLAINVEYTEQDF